MDYIDYEVNKNFITQFMTQEDKLFLFINAAPGTGKTHFIKNYLVDNQSAVRISMPPTGNIRDLYFLILTACTSMPIKNQTNIQLRHTVVTMLSDFQELKLILVDDSQNLLYGADYKHILDSLKWLAESTSTEFVFLGTHIPELPEDIARRSIIHEHYSIAI